MPQREIRPRSQFSVGYRVFTAVFILLFSLAFLFLAVFGLDDIPDIPVRENIPGIIKYCITVIFDLAIFCMLAFINFYLFRENFSERPRNIDYTATKTNRQIYAAIICFALTGAKVVFSVLTNIIASTNKWINEDRSSIVPWFVAGFFILLSAGLFMVFLFVIRRFRKAKNASKMDVFRGVVSNKQMLSTINSNLMSRPGEISSYNMELDTGKKFENVQRSFYEQVRAGQSVEVYTIPFVGEITGIKVL